MDRRQVKAGDFVVSGPPASGETLTKVYAVKSLEEVDEKFDEATRLQAVMEQTRKAIAALNGGSK